MNRDIEQYLRRATRGLWGSKRLEVREELSAHIKGRVNAHLVGGVAEETAIHKTLQELGEPAQVSVGMTKLHSAPTLMTLATTMSVIVLIVFTLITGSMAQSLPGTFYWPSEACVSAIEDGKVSGDALQDILSKRIDSDCFSPDNSLWLDFDALRPILEEDGIETEALASGTKLFFPNGDYIILKPGNDDVYVADDENKRILTDPRYFDLWELVKSAAHNPDIPLEISGWDNPTIRIGEASFQVGTRKQPFQGADFYENYLMRVLFGGFSLFPGQFDYVDIVNPRTERLAQRLELEFFGDWDESFVTKTELQVNARDSASVFGIIIILDLENPLVHQPADHGETHEFGASFYMTLAQADADGSVTLELPSDESVAFVDTFSPTPTPGEAVLVELAADASSWFKVVSPEDIRLE